MNCENMLPLQRCAGVEFGEFVEGMKKETIVRYLLERSVEESFGEDKKGLKEYLLKEGE